MYSRRLDIVNRGYGGYNTPMARDIFDDIFAKRDTPATPVRLLTLWFGTNDSTLPPNTRYVTVEKFVEHMDFFLESFTSPNSPYAIAHGPPLSIILITPPHPYRTPEGMEPMEQERFDRLKQFRDAVLDIGKRWKAKEDGARWKIATIDFWSVLLKAADGDEDKLKPFFLDYVHFTAEGYVVLWDAVREVIGTEFQGRGIDWREDDDLPMTHPW